MKREIREEARQLRENGMSVREITKILGVSKSSISLWVRDIVLTEGQIGALKARQSRFEGQHTGAKANRERAKNVRSLYQINGRERAKEQRPLHLVGCMLYWAEGAKGKNAIYFVNSDPNMMTLFRKFLSEELHVQADDMRIHIHCHSSDPDEMRRIETYWLDLLQIPLACLRKTQVKKGSDTRKNILHNGVCGLRVNSTELVQHIYGAIQEYGGFDNPDWLF